MIAWFVRDIWHKYHSWYFTIVSNFTRLTAREITFNNFEIQEISLVKFMPNITTNHAITYTNMVLYNQFRYNMYARFSLWSLAFTEFFLILYTHKVINEL